MCKIKDALIRAEEVKLHYHYNFMEALYEMMPQVKPLSEKDIDDMEKSYGNSSKLIIDKSSEILPSSSLNNQFYEPNEENYYAN